MKILYCIFSLAPPGGMQRVLTTKANYLSDVCDHTVHIATKACDPSATPAVPFYPLSPNVRIHEIRLPYRKTLTNLVFTLHPDIVISMYGEEYSFLYKLRDGSKKILEFHYTRHHLQHLIMGIAHLRLRRLRLIYAKFLDKRVAWHAHFYHRLILLTAADRKLWGQPPNAVVIPNPLSFTSSRKSDLSANRVLAIGRFIATKGFDLLIEAYRPVAALYPTWKLSIYGEGQDHTYLQKMIGQYNLTDNIELLPPTKDIRVEMVKSSIYALSSRYEGFGLVLIEAMECGIPCVSFDCECGPAEIITSGEDGILVSRGDIAAFSEALLQLIGSPGLRKKLGEQAMLKARQFSVGQVMPKWEKLFNEVIHEQ